MSRGLDKFGCLESETWHLAVHVFKQDCSTQNCHLLSDKVSQPVLIIINLCYICDKY